MTDHKKLDKFVSTLGFSYSADFVPFSKSRNAKDTKDIKSLSDYSLNWKIELNNGRVSLITDYMQGIGHLPKEATDDLSTIRNSIHNHELIKAACEVGKYTIKYHTYKLPIPELRDILYSLIMDADAIDYPFEDWCDNFGYEQDSRKAESIYQDCLKIGLKLRQLVGDKGIKKLQELYQDY